MNEDFDKIGTLNARLHFCEDFAASEPLDRAHPTGPGPLAGRIVGVKSNICVAGQGWTGGIGARVTEIADMDAAVVAALRAAGAAILSRLAMDEGALGASTDNPHFGRCDNPAWPGHSAGGSSGGSAAAVAAGAVHAALGSDTMGSVRIPAAYCGVYGLKLGADTVDMGGVLPLAPSLDALGLFAASPGGLTDLLAVLAPECTAPEISGWCILRDDSLPNCDKAVRSAYDVMRGRMHKLFGDPVVMDGFDLPALRRDAFVLTEAEAVTSLGDQPGLSTGLDKLIAYGRTLTPEKLDPLRARLAVARADARQALGAGRVLLTPTVAQPAFAHGERPPVGQADLTVLANIAGLPALAIPMAGADYPVSVQLVGPPGADAALPLLAARLG